MSDPIEIKITDGVDASIAPKIEAIATAADAGSAALAELQAAADTTAANVLQATTATTTLSVGLDSARISARDFAALLLQTGNDLTKITEQMAGLTSGPLPELTAEATAAGAAVRDLGTGATATSGALRGLTQAQVDLYRALQEGSNFLADLNASFVLANKSARDSAQAFIDEATAVDTAAAALASYTTAQINMFRAQQEGANFLADLNASFLVSGASARESAQAFIDEATAAEQASAALLGLTTAQLNLLRAQQDGANFLTNLNAGFALSGKSARESAAVFIEVAAALEAEDAAFAAVNARLAVNNAAVATGSTVVAAFRAQLIATTEAEAAAAAATTELAASTDKAKTAFSGFLPFLAGLFAINETVKAIDNYTKLTNAIKVAGLAGQAATDQFNFLTDTAEKNGIAVDAVATLYQRLAVAQATVGLGADKMNSLITLLTQSFRVQALDAAHVTNTLRDFNDIVESGSTTFTRYFNNLQRADFALVAAAAHGLGITIDELDASVKNGSVNAKEFLDGLIKGKTYMQDLADATNLTINGALNNLQTAFTKLVFSANEGTGAIGLISKSIQLLADNLPLVATLVLVFGAAWTTVKLIEIAQSVYDVYLALKELQFGLLLLDTGLSEVLVIVAAVVAVFALGAYAVAAMTGKVDDLNATLLKGADIASNFVGSGISRVTGALKEATAVSPELQKAITAANAALGDATATSGKATAALTAQTSATTALTRAMQPYVASFNGVDTLVTHQSANVIQLTGDLVSAADAYQTAGDQAQFFGVQVYETITKADGSTAALLTYKNTVDNLGQSMNATAQAAANLNSAIASGKFPNISALAPQTSFPDISTLAPDTSSSDITTLPAYATGGSFKVGGSGGTDTNRVSFWATQGERVDVLTPDQQRRQAANGNGRQTVINATVNIIANDVASFNKSKAQVSRAITNTIAAGAQNG